MSERGQPDLTRLLRDLTRELQTLQREIENRDRRSVSTRRQLTRFTSEVAIPGVILLLETNIRALKLLRRAIRLADGRDPRQGGTDTATGELRDRAERLGTATLSRLDETLAEVQSSLENGGDDEVREMVAEARKLQREIRDRIEESGPAERSSAEAGQPRSGAEGDEMGDDHVTIDVESELRTLKDDIENTGDGPGVPSGDDSDTDQDDDSDGDDTDHDPLEGGDDEDDGDDHSEDTDDN